MDIFSIVGKVAVDGSDAVSQLNKVQKSAKGTADSLESVDSASNDAGSSIQDVSDNAGEADSKFTTWKATLSQLAAQAITAVISKLSDLASSIVESYGDYEQLVGGVDTLFKESSQTIQDYAAIAYKTAGLSANEYMETVTSFSASLIQSLGGDTAAAAEYANTAITDMSDNANKMGSDMESLQNAYSGFAKQNYTIKLMSAA